VSAVGAKSVRRAALSCLFAFAFLCAPSSAQTRRRVTPVEERPVYPYAVVPVDAIRGHLMNGWFKEPVDVHFDALAQELLVADSKNGLIGIFDPEGTPLFTFGGKQLLTDPRKVVTTEDGSIFVLDADQSEIKAFSYRGEILPPLRFAYPATEEESGGVAKVNAFCRDAEGNWYVGDVDRPQVLVYDADLKLKFAIRPEPAGARFGVISGLAVAPDGAIAVTDFKETPVQLFDSKGRFLAGWGARDIGIENFSAPADVAFDEEGHVFVVDMLRHDVKIFSRTGEFRGFFGGWYSAETGGRGPGEMLYPSGITIAPDGFIYVAERFGQRVQIFTREPRESAEDESNGPEVGESANAGGDGEVAEPPEELAASDVGSGDGK